MANANSNSTVQDSKRRKEKPTMVASHSTTRPNTRRGPAKPNAAMPLPSADDCDPRKTNGSKSRKHSGDSVFCPKCCESIDQSCFNCDICRDSIHPHCTGLSADSYEILMSIVQESGWVCVDCRTRHRDKISQLQTSLSRAHEEVADLRALMVQLKHDLDDLKCQAPVQLPSADIMGNKEHKVEDKDDDKFSHNVTKIIYDMQQRKSNVVISGLPEPHIDVSDPCLADADTFTRLCEEHLSIKPTVIRHNCKRLGQPSGNRPRKLLVRLHSESAAQSILKAARELRMSDDSTIAANVYINPDLSPAEAKIAFQKRQRKRDRLRGGGAGGNGYHKVEDRSNCALFTSSNHHRSEEDNGNLHVCVSDIRYKTDNSTATATTTSTTTAACPANLSSTTHSIATVSCNDATSLFTAVDSNTASNSLPAAAACAVQPFRNV